MSDPNEARKAETTGVAAFTFRGQRFEIVTDYSEWPLELHEALEDGRNIAVLREALGPAQWAVVREMRLKTPGLNELAGAVTKALGFKSVGESEASTG